VGGRFQKSYKEIFLYKNIFFTTIFKKIYRGMFGRALTSVPCGLIWRNGWQNQEGKKKENPLERGWG
jgi:hypothetical protein